MVSASVIPSEVENKVIYTVLSKPVRRIQYLFGKFAGVRTHDTILATIAAFRELMA